MTQTDMYSNTIQNKTSAYFVPQRVTGAACRLFIVNNHVHRMHQRNNKSNCQRIQTSKLRKKMANYPALAAPVAACLILKGKKKKNRFLLHKQKDEMGQKAPTPMYRMVIRDDKGIRCFISPHHWLEKPLHDAAINSLSILVLFFWHDAVVASADN